MFGEDASKNYDAGDVIALTETYRYKDTNTLSTKKSWKIEVCLTFFQNCILKVIEKQ